MALLEVENLQTHFRTPDGVNRAVDGVSFHLEEGETLAVVGETGCGKSVTANSILRLIPEPPGRIAGAIRFQGTDLLKLPESAMRRMRGNDISMIFQEPMTSLNPVLTVGRQLGETLRQHERLSRREADDRAVEMLRLVGIPEARRRLDEYPHQLSGGMRQRVMIAIALVLPAQAADRRRADHGARRHHPGADPGPHEGPQDQDRRRHHPDHARPRRRRRGGRAGDGHVCGPHGGGGAGGRALPQPAAPLHPGPVRGGPQARLVAERRAEPPRRDPRRGAQPEAAHSGCVFASRCALATDLCRQVAPALEPRRRGTGPPATSRRRRRSPHERAPAAGERPQEALPRARGVARHPRRHRPRRGRRVVQHRQGRDAGAGRRVRLRQVHRRALHPAAARRHGRPGGARRPAHRRSVGRRAAPVAAAHAGGVPGPVLQPQPAPKVRDILAEPMRNFGLAKSGGRSARSGSRG